MARGWAGPTPSPPEDGLAPAAIAAVAPQRAAGEAIVVASIIKKVAVTSLGGIACRFLPFYFLQNGDRPWKKVLDTSRANPLVRDALLVAG